MKPFYVDYVNHMLRFYFRSGEILNEPDRVNAECVRKVLEDSAEWDREIVRELFSGPELLQDGVVKVSAGRGVGMDVVWTVVSKVSRRLAKERGLI